MTDSTSGGPSPYTPVGSVLGPGSTALVMTPREEQVAILLALGYSYKRIASATGSPEGTVGTRVAKIAARIPGVGTPRQRVSAWMWTYGSQSSNG